MKFLVGMANFFASTHSESMNVDSDYKNREVNIQAMPTNGGPWVNVGSYMNIGDDGYALANAMENSQRQFPSHRIRAVNGHGHLLAML